MVDQKEAKSLKNGNKIPALWGWHTYVSIAITVVILGCLAAMLDLREIWREIAATDKKFLVLGGLAHYATYPVRGWRWRRCLLHLSPKGGAGRFGLLVFFYNFIDNVVPAKLGDVYGAHLARINFGIRRSAAMGSIVFVRTVDAWIVLLLASLASWLLFSARMTRSVVWSLIGGTVIAVAATSVVLIFFLFRNSLPRWLPEKIQQMIHAFRRGMSPRPREIMPIAFLTVLIWVLETVWIVFLALAFNLRLSPAEAVFLTMLPLLASAFPLTPSGAGAVELTLFSCLRVVGVAAPTAVSLTVVNRFIDYWLHIGLGLLTWAIRRSIGLRTWREVPLEDLQAATSPEATLSQEAFHGN
jgi:uncharacterized protein (TIRG00374 family)